MDFYSNSQTPMVIALGFFDGVHLGHKLLIEKAKTMLEEGDSLAVFTIDGNFFKNSEGNIFSLNEKTQIFKSLGVDLVVTAQACEQFFSLTAEEFVHLLLKNHNIKGVVVGEDFTFGKNALGNAQFLKDLCNSKGIRCEICQILCKDGQKISASNIKKSLSQGDIENANKMLGINYFISGKVVRGRGVGAKDLFPTANISIAGDKFRLKRGVYATQCQIDGVVYNAVTNYGNCPTYGQNDFVIETFILDFNGNIYDRELKIEFLSFLREITKFSSVEQLKKQIKKDTEYFL